MRKRKVETEKGHISTWGGGKLTRERVNQRGRASANKDQRENGRKAEQSDVRLMDHPDLIAIGRLLF